MSLWTEVAIGNLLRHRGPPLDIIDEGDELIRCKGKCDELKPASDYYMKYDNRSGKSRRQALCKVCVCERDKAAKKRNKKPQKPKRPPRKFSEMLSMLDTGAKTVRQLYEGLGISRRTANYMLDELIADGEAYRSTTPEHIRNPRTPPMFSRRLKK